MRNHSASGALAALAAARRLLAEHLAARAGAHCAAAAAAAPLQALPRPASIAVAPLATPPGLWWQQSLSTTNTTTTTRPNPWSRHHHHHHHPNRPPAAASYSSSSSSSSDNQHTCGPACNHDDHGKGAANANAHANANAADANATAAHQHASLSPSSLEQQDATCWSCNHATRRGGVVCRGCDRIQPLDSQALTYYELFGYGAGGGQQQQQQEKTQQGGHHRRQHHHHPPYRLDARDLERRYRELQWALHPDRLTGPGRDAREVQHGAAAAALVNQAYGVLRSPLARANYLLMLRRLPQGGAGGGTGAGGGDPAARRAAEQHAARLEEEEERRTAVDPALLMEVMEAREAVEDADDPAQLRAMLSANREAQAALVERLGAALDGDEVGNEGGEGEGEYQEAALARAQELAARLSYLVRIQQAIEAKL
jgi:molecular chaperone HscB